MFKRALLAASIGLIAATSHAETLLSEDFADITKLNGWVLTNNSASPNPARTVAGGWGQGDADVYGIGSQAGGTNAYIVSDYNVALPGTNIDQWLITPTFATDKAVQVSFYARAGSDPAYSDALSWGFNTSGGASLGGFTMGQSVTIGGDQWQLYTVTLNAQGAGSFARFAIEYGGAADNSNFVGIDSLTVNAVPEPATFALAALGLFALALTARRSRKGMAVVALAGAAAALPLAAQAGEEPAADAAVSSTDSQIVVRDAATGQLRAATGDEAKALLQLRAGHAQGQTLKLMHRKHPSGAVGVRLTDEFMSHSVVVRQPDGRLTEYCFSTAEEAEATVKSAAPAAPQSNPLPTE
jgi:hypothetical protein